jgi:hypothetical protein
MPQNLIEKLKDKFSKQIKDLGITEVFIDDNNELHTTSEHDLPEDLKAELYREAKLYDNNPMDDAFIFEELVLSEIKKSNKVNDNDLNKIIFNNKDIIKNKFEGGESASDVAGYILGMQSTQEHINPIISVPFHKTKLSDLGKGMDVLVNNGEDLGVIIQINGNEITVETSKGEAIYLPDEIILQKKDLDKLKASKPNKIIHNSYSDFLSREGLALEKEMHKFEIGTKIKDNISGLPFSVDDIMEDKISLSLLSTFIAQGDQPLEVSYSSLINRFKEGKISVEGFEFDDSMVFVRVLNAIQFCKKMDRLEREHEALKSEHNTLKSGHEVLKSESEILKSEYNSLKSEHDTMKTEHSGLKSEYDNLNTGHETLKSENEALKNSINDKQKKQKSGFTEVTFVNDGDEVMVHILDDGEVEKIYTYKDFSDEKFKSWKVGKNPLFVHADKKSFKNVIKYLKEKFVYDYDDRDNELAEKMFAYYKI